MVEDPRFADSERELENAILVEVMRLNALASGLVNGLIAGLILFLATNWLVLKGGPIVGPHLALLGQYFIGYRVSFVGSLIGFAYAFVVGFALGYFVAYTYNWLVHRLHR